MEHLKLFLSYANFFIIYYFLIVNFSYILLLIFAFKDVSQRFHETRIGNIQKLTASFLLPPVTVLIPAYNEGEGVLHTLASLSWNEYKNTDIIVIDDGSTDGSLDLLINKYELYEVTSIIPKRVNTVAKLVKLYHSKILKNLTVIVKEHTGKADSLNWGINATKTPYLITVDADSIIKNDALNIAVFSALSESHVIAMGGSVMTLNGCTYKNGKILEQKVSFSPLVGLQTCEYLRAFFFGRAGWKDLGGPLVLSGTMSLFEHQALVEVKGFKMDSPGEDMEIIVKLNQYMLSHKYPYKILFSAVPMIWTHIPKSLFTIWRQRDRWHRGSMDSLFSHINMLFNPRYGKVGLVVFPFQLFGEMMAPVVEVFGYIVLGLSIYLHIVKWEFVILFIIACWGLASIFTAGVILLNRLSFDNYTRLSDALWMLFCVLLEMVGYRQFLSLCRTIATFRFFFSKLFRRSPKKSFNKKDQLAPEW